MQQHHKFFSFLFTVKLKSLAASGLIEVFKILPTDNFQLLYTCSTADTFKPRDFVGKRRWLMLPVIGIFNHFL